MAPSMQLGKPSNGVKLLLYLDSFVSVVVTITTIVFFATRQQGSFFTAQTNWGEASDFSSGVFALVMLPVVFNLRSIYRASKSKISDFTLAVGVIGVLGFAVASFVLSAKGLGLIGFDLIASVLVQFFFYFIFAAWFLMFGFVLKASGIKHAIRMSLLAITLFAYPVWAIWLARQVSVKAHHDLPKA
jgi:hypothetical protein